jgi:hypothetical protein
MTRILFTIAFFLLSTIFVLAQSEETPSLLIKAEPGTIVWVDNLRYGAVPEGGELTIKNLKAGCWANAN